MSRYDTGADEHKEQNRAGYLARDYTGEPCTHCGRNRVMNCANGKHICEKCKRDQDAGAYDLACP